MGPILFNIFVNDLGDGAECTISKFANVAELREGIDTASGWEGTQQVGEIGRVKIHEVQQRETRSHKPGEGVTPRTRTGCGNQLKSSFERKKKPTKNNPVGLGGQQIDYKPGMCPYGKEGRQLPGLWEKEYQQQVEEGDPSPLLPK